MNTKVLTPRESWQLLGIGRTKFYQLLAEGKIRYFKNGRRYLISDSAIDAFIQEQTVKSVKAGDQ